MQPINNVSRHGVLVTVSKPEHGMVRVRVDRVVRDGESWKTCGMIIAHDFPEGKIPENFFHVVGWLAITDASLREFGDEYQGQVYTGSFPGDGIGVIHGLVKLSSIESRAAPLAEWIPKPSSRW